MTNTDTVLARLDERLKSIEKKLDSAIADQQSRIKDADDKGDRLSDRVTILEQRIGIFAALGAALVFISQIIGVIVSTQLLK